MCWSVSFSQEAALKTFHISDDPKNYYVTEICESGRRSLLSCHLDVAISLYPVSEIADPGDGR